MDRRTRVLLGKMIGLLGSDQEGEICAAARQIRRLLESKGLSFADLVALVEGEERAIAPLNPLQDMAEAILRNEPMMKTHERKFVQDVAARVKAWAGFQLTEKQARWFSFLYAKYGD